MIRLWKEIRSWFYHSFNIKHYNVVKEAFLGQPYDYGYLLQLEQNKLIEMLEYYKQGHITTKETYDKITRDIRLCINLLDIMLDKVETFRFDGESKFIETTLPNGEVVYEMDKSKLVYVPLVTCNTRNIHRFYRNEKRISYILQRKHELYKEKATRLYYHIRRLYTYEWWD